MDLQNIKRSLRRELSNPKNQELFEMARRHNTAFVNHSTLFSVLAALDDRSVTDYTEKETLTRSLIREQQRASNPLWAAILITAYLPMLGRLRSRITGNPLPPKDLDQIIITSFLQVVKEFPLSKWRDHTCVKLRQQTQRRVFRELNQERAHQNFWDPRSFEEILEQELEDMSIWELSRSDKYDSRDVEMEITLLLDYIGNAIDPGKLDLVIATTFNGESLWDFIKLRRLFSTNALNNREYQRLKRQRSRTLKKIRKILEEKMSLTKEDSAL
jgi:hypothetical protein